MDSLVLPGNGIGDAIVISGAVDQIAKKSDKVIIPAPAYNRVTLESLFADYPNVEIANVAYHQRDFLIASHPDATIYRCSWDHYTDIHTPAIGWDVWMYKQAGIDFKHRYESCTAFTASRHVRQKEFQKPYRLIHQKPRDGYTITALHESDINTIYVDWDEESILSWVQAIRVASEIHVIDSSFWHLVNSVPGVTAKLYFHKYARMFIPIWHDVQCSYNWEVITTPGTYDHRIPVTFDSLKRAMRNAQLRVV